MTIYCLHSLVAQTCMGMHAHTNRCTHSPCVLLDCLPLPFVGSLPSLSPSAILLAPYPFISPALFSLILSLISIPQSVSVRSVFFLFPSAIASSSFIPCFSSVCLVIQPSYASSLLFVALHRPFLSGCRPVWVRDRL